MADVIDVRAEDEFARVELLVSLKQELESLTQRANDYSYLFGLSYRGCGEEA